MRNFAQPGNTVTLTAPRTLQSGDGVVIGTAFGVAATAVASGGKAEISVEGCFAFKRAPGLTLTDGAVARFDETTQELVGTGGAVIGYVVGHPSAAEGESPDNPAYTWVKLIPSAATEAPPVGP